MPYKKYFITYGDHEYFIHRKRLSLQAKRFNYFDKVIDYKKSDISKNFKIKYKELFKYKKGGGFWIWKYYIILRTLETMKDGDIVMYLDSGSTLNNRGKKRLQEYFELLNSSSHTLLMFEVQNLIERDWAVKEVLNYFNYSSNSIEATSPGIMATSFFIKKTPTSQLFFEEILKIASHDYNFFTDFYSTQPQEEYFNAHRHDQTILSLMAKKHGYLSLPDETQYFQDSSNQYTFPILTIRDSKYTLWQKVKFFSFYFLNIRKTIYFGEEQPYFKRTPLLIKFQRKVRNKFNQNT
ncbi:hypothetical protein OAY26_02495 [Acidimicrobiia bacterium]|nr:hypothetical protein [Acidimicrobiia bacterium]